MIIPLKRKKFTIFAEDMEDERFIQVILPLRLEWEPYYLVPEELSVAVGDRVQVEFANKRYVGVVSAVDGKPADELKPRILYIVGREPDLPPVDQKEIRFWRDVADYYLCTVGEVYKAALARDAKALSARKIPAIEPHDIQLSPLQEEAAQKAREAFEAHKTALLHGVTGAGKTEIYLKLAQEVLQSGRSVLFLVPEIALSRQLEERVAAVFPEVLVYHSAQTPARRAQVATAIRVGEKYLVLGTRSALFLPHRNLGLIIVDEEHDSSFKQDSPAPRYHAREASIMLGLTHNAAVLLGSATPSLESLYNAETGKFVKIDLKERFHSGKEADLLIIDTVAERRKNGMVGHLSLKLLEQIQRVLASGGQAVLLRSRRSYAPAVQCTECGDIPKCPHCHVSLSLHLQPERLVCHYCGHTEPYRHECAHCGGALQPLGAGTQRIEEEVRAAFPNARVARLDSDHSAQENSLIRQFSKGEIDILVGTQVVTKGFDFANLALVAVIQADNILAQQDFRADERAIQLLEQFRGRSGRRGEPGLFVIQTREPDHPVFARLGEAIDNTPQMMAERRLFGYPPYTRLIHVTLKDSNEKRVAFLAEELARSIGLPLVGPYTPLVDKVADRYICQIRLMFPRDKVLRAHKQQLLSAINTFEKTHKYFGHIVLDVDPL